jgi:succinate dehydrogenase / fumarate reductase, cytochrome b subunit
MNGWKANISSSVGKKLLMAVTGLCFCGFLVGHLLGNLTIYGGGELFNSYAEHLQALGIILRVVEAGLICFALVHIGTGLLLFFQNWMARPVRYHVNKRAGGRTLGSATMPYTGVLLLSFILFHLFHFTFVDKTDTTIYELVAAAFQNPLYDALYVVAVIVAGVHVSHGFWSAFQSFGLNHPKYMPLIKGVGLALAIVVAIGFGSLPVYMSLTA